MLHDYVVRPATLHDIDAIDRLAHDAKLGMTSLPRDRGALQKKLILSHRAFHDPVKAPNGEVYFFVLEHAITRTVVGTCKLVSRAGVSDPSTAFQIEKSVQRSVSMDKSVATTLLHPKIHFGGPTEIGGLYVDSSHREKGLGRLVSLSRFLFLAMHRERFADNVMAEMRGVITPDGTSPFWDAVGRKLFDMDFQQADYMAAVDRSFILDLLPHFPIYADLLPDAAVSVISQTHEETVPALRLLQQEGFRITDLIDVFDAGPKVNAPVDDIRTVQEARFARVGSVVSEMDRIFVEGTHSDEPVFLMSNGKLENFRSCMGYLDVDGDTITLSRSYATLLNVKAGDVMWFSPLIPHSFLRRFERWYSKVPILSGDAGPKAKGRRSVR